MASTKLVKNQLLVQPDNGVTPVVAAIESAKTSIELVIFRFDRGDIETAIVKAVERGVRVRALIAHTSRGGERALRNLESRLLKAGVTVSRTAEDLLRYHSKFLVIDGKELLVLGFNFTYIDVDRSRSFGLRTRDRALIEEAKKLFDADSGRKPYVPAHPRFLVSPLNARRRLMEFIAGARKELLIYDPNISDKQLLHTLESVAGKGVRIRAIGYSPRLAARHLAGMRLHVRAIVRDGSTVFIGSQSLRATELDRRREVGIVVKDTSIASALQEIFESDWKKSEPAEAFQSVPVSPARIAKKIAKVVAKELPPLEPLLDEVLKEAGEAKLPSPPDWDSLQYTVEEAVKEAVKEVVKDAVETEVGA